MPPNPNELLITRRTGAETLSSRMRDRKDGSGSVTPRQPGRKPWRMREHRDRRLQDARRRRACGPTSALVELHGIAVPNTPATARSSIASLRARAGAVQVDVVDRRPGPRRRCASAWRIAAAAPAPCGCWRRHVISVAGGAAAEQGHDPCRLRRRSSRAKPAASPIEMPLRSASHGRHGSRRDQVERREAVQRHAAEAVGSAHHRRVADAALDQIARHRMKLRALEAQAVESVSAGPRSPSACRTKRASENRSWVRS